MKIEAFDANGPIRIPTSEELRAHHEKLWTELPGRVKEALVATTTVILGKMDPSDLKKLVSEIQEKPDTWSTPYHFSWGMSMRNQIRGLGIADRDTPSGNLDDYYVKAIEVAVKRVMDAS